MKRAEDDIAVWQLRQENMSKPFPYVFPQMPPRFRRCCLFMKLLFLLEWSGMVLITLSGLAAVLFLIFCGKAAFDALFDSLLRESALFALLMLTVMVSLPLGFVCRLLRHTPKFFWRCPCCGLPFPYHAPPLRGLDVLKEADCLYSMEHLRIKYVKTRFCPLIVPSVCPECKCKFFDMESGFSTKDG